MLATKRGDLQQKLINRARALGVKVRYYPVSQLRIAIKDGIESAQTIVNPNDLTDRTTIVIASIELTRALEHYFDVVWKKAELT